MCVLMELLVGLTHNGFVFLFYQTTNLRQAPAVQKASRNLGAQQAAREGGAPAQQWPPRSPQSVSPQTHSRYSWRLEIYFNPWLHKNNHQCRYFARLLKLPLIFFLSHWSQTLDRVLVRMPWWTCTRRRLSSLGLRMKRGSILIRTSRSAAP